MSTKAGTPQRRIEQGLDTSPKDEATLELVWQEVIRAASDQARTLTALYTHNPALFTIRQLEGLLGVNRKGQLATALRVAGVRDTKTGPTDGLGELRQGGILSTPYEVYTIHGAIAAWHVVRTRKLCSLTAESLAHRLLAYAPFS